MNSAERIKTIRREMLVSLKAIYPSSLEAQSLYRAMLAAFPDMEFDHLRQDLSYLLDKGYIARTMPRSHDHPDLIAWKYRWFCLTAAGVEIADRVRFDEALEI